MGGEVEADHNGAALGIAPAVALVDEPLVYGHTLCAEALHPTLHLDVVAQAGLTHHIGLDASQYQVDSTPIDAIAKYCGVELHLAQIEVLLQVDVVDVAEGIGVGKTLLYLGGNNHNDINAILGF